MSAKPPLRLAVLISGRGSNMTAIVRACLAGAIAARPVIVIADRPQAAGLASAASLGVATATVAAGTGAGAGAPFEQQLGETLAAAQPDFVALAGFMRVLSAAFVARYAGRMLNIHPSLLPAYRGLHTHRRVLAAGERVHGASVHFVTAELDGGPVVLQSTLAVQPGDTAATLAARVQATEHIIYPRALGWFAQGRLAWHDNAAWLDGQRLKAPVVEDFGAAVRG
ncbi:MAG TPA: phosphoribosylglycinamide formyltransferase [Steroidobacteraceae bacterium]|jgi:phosphoribosylglycinamide formyltransferase-1|nr:phosphoribosylglycinamide formyltransferase [Steroidobacteraceae bacterium]